MIARVNGCCRLDNDRRRFIMPDVTISEQHLRSFRETLRAGSVRGAADRLDVEPSVVSRHLKCLQDRLDVRLFERRGRGIAPTAAAALVAEFCEARDEQEALLMTRLTDAGHALSG